MNFQNDANIITELNELKSDSLIRDFNITYNNNEEDLIKIKHFDITLLENTILHIQLTDTFCYQDINTKHVYESFESLLQNTSPLYAQRFNELVFQKLMKK